MAAAPSFDDLIPKTPKTPGSVSFDDLVPKKPSSLVDSARSVPGGLAQGLAALVGGGGSALKEVPKLLGRATDAIFGGGGDTVTAAGQNLGQASGVNLPTAEQANTVLSAPTGGYYKPQTPLGELTQTVSSFWPAAVFPTNAASRTGDIAKRASRVIVPATVSEAGGQAGKGTKWESPLRNLGAIAGGGITEAAPTIAGVVARTANRGWSAAGGREFLDPNNVARDYVTRAVNRDGGVPTLRQRLQDWQQSGASAPALIDVTGNNTRRLVRSAASGASGEAQNIAQDYTRGIEANVQDRAADLARGLTPDEQRSGAAVAADLEQRRGTLATEQYREPYAEPAAVTREMVSALQGPEGRAAIGRAYLAARARRNVQQMGELQDLLGVAGEQGGGRDPLTGRVRSLEDALQGVSAGSLDRVRIAMRNIGGRLSATGANDIAGGYAERTADIDTALDQTPGLREARGNYRNISQQIDAIPVGQAATRTPGQLYGEQLEAMSPEARRAAGIGYRDSLVAGIEQPTAGGTGFLNRVANSNQQTSNLANQYGPEVGARFQAGVGNEVSRVQNARFISPNTGSQTALRAEETGLIDAIPTTHLGVLTRAIGAIRNGLTLTANQRAAIVRYGVSEADIQAISRQMPRARADAVARQILVAGQLSNRRQ